MKNKKFPIDVSGPSISNLEKKYVLDALSNGWYGKNKYYYVEKFEKDFAKFHKRSFALMTPNCTSAIHLLLLSLGIKKGDEVIVPETTWIATASPIAYVGAKPIFCDVEKNSWCMCPKELRRNITKKTKAVIVVGVYGNMPKMFEIEKILKEKKIPFIEDAAESLGSKYKNIKSGKFGLASVFSFHRTKTLTTGEGGMLTTDNKKIYERCKFLRDHGRKPSSYFFEELAYKYMPFNLQAALGYAQFKRLKELVDKKRWIFYQYKKNLNNLTDIQFNIDTKEIYNSFWHTHIVLGNSYKINSNKLSKELEKKNIPTRPFFYPLSSMPVFRKRNLRKKNKISYLLNERGIGLPNALNLTKTHIRNVCKELSTTLKKYKI